MNLGFPTSSIRMLRAELCRLAKAVFTRGAVSGCVRKCSRETRKRGALDLAAGIVQPCQNLSPQRRFLHETLER